MLDRDALPDGLTENRRAVPQGRHAHGLGGQLALEQLFPGFTEEALAEGAQPMKPGIEMRFCIGGHDLAKIDMGGKASVASRPLLEGLVRRRVAALHNVTIRDRVAVNGLVADGDRVRGVKLKDGGRQQILRSDLVVAASGRECSAVAPSRGPRRRRRAARSIDVKSRAGARSAASRAAAPRPIVSAVAAVAVGVDAGAERRRAASSGVHAVAAGRPTASASSTTSLAGRRTAASAESPSAGGRPPRALAGLRRAEQLLDEVDAAEARGRAEVARVHARLAPAARRSARGPRTARSTSGVPPVARGRTRRPARPASSSSCASCGRPT